MSEQPAAPADGFTKWLVVGIHGPQARGTSAGSRPGRPLEGRVRWCLDRRRQDSAWTRSCRSAIGPPAVSSAMTHVTFRRDRQPV